MATQRTLKLNLLADVDKFGKGLDKAGRDAQGFGGKVKKYGKIAAGALAAVGVAAAGMAAKFGLDAVKAASDLSEELSKAQVIFGETAKDIEKFGEQAAQSLGLSKKEAVTAASTFATFGKAAGLTGQDLGKFSKSATTLAADLGSFYNTRAEDAINAIGSALRGESEPIRKYGVLLNQVTIEAKAVEMGLYDGEGALSAQAKTLATYQVILDQTKDAQGDFARTSDGLAGQQKILTSELENLKAEMGKGLLPMMTNVITEANKVARAFSGKDADGLSERARELSGNLGDSGAGSLGRSLKILADAFGTLFKAFTEDGNETTDGMQELAEALNNVATGINAIATAYRNAKTALNFIDRSGGFDTFGRFKGLPKPKTGIAIGGTVRAGQAYNVGEFGKEVFIPRTSGQIIPNNRLGGGGNTFIFNGVIDGESARRSIERIMQNSTLRTGAVNLAGSPL
jgi:hypothetical protein